MNTGELRSFPGVLFTNERGQVIFADRQLCSITKRVGTWSVTWEPLHQFLGLDADTASYLLTAIGQTGHVADQPLEIRDADGQRVHVLCSGAALYDDEGSFVGTDLKFWVRRAPGFGTGLLGYHKIS